MVNGWVAREFPLCTRRQTDSHNHGLGPLLSNPLNPAVRLHCWPTNFNACLRLPYLKDLTMSQIDPTQQRIEQIVKSSDVVLFMKGTAQFPMCGFSGRAIQVLKACGVTKPATVNVLEDEGIRNGIKEYSNWPTIPQLYVKGEFVGGSDIMMEMYQNGELQEMLGAPPEA